jgi:hypothetical protein
LLAAGRVPEAVRWVTDCLTIVRDLRWVSFEPWPASVLAEAALADGGDGTASPADLERCFALSCGAEAASRDLVALAARAHLDGLLPGAVRSSLREQLS